jgi:hypothetical protein
MKQAESKVRYFHTGLILLAVLGACNSGLTESPAGSQEFDASYYGQNQGDRVTVKVAVGNGASNSSRSVDPSNAELFSNFYEVVFKKGSNYYRGEEPPSKGI